MVADAVIYHPTVSHYLKYVATSGMFVYLGQQVILDTGVLCAELKSCKCYGGSKVNKIV